MISTIFINGLVDRCVHVPRLFVVCVVVTLLASWVRSSMQWFDRCVYVPRLFVVFVVLVDLVGILAMGDLYDTMV